ncbi:hypothetical protein DDD64_01675 [Actinotignum sanguinis]|uniref:hypothetical protein n=1 Tax=Actinotignum sanguinis TaxID=1445614 RepID=UPI000F7E5CE8|nr:hypothetical protein [Actinotignum sanguinis]MDY5147620.1 hypothetical protein [Actinotignum sanguinis]RTE51332.1 hypothetical protein DDD64_01675 [Actinotignum sanguinis]
MIKLYHRVNSAIDLTARRVIGYRGLFSYFYRTLWLITGCTLIFITALALATNNLPHMSIEGVDHDFLNWIMLTWICLACGMAMVAMLSTISMRAHLQAGTTRRKFFTTLARAAARMSAEYLAITAVLLLIAFTFIRSGNGSWLLDGATLMNGNAMESGSIWFTLIPMWPGVLALFFTIVLITTFFLRWSLSTLGRAALVVIAFFAGLSLVGYLVGITGLGGFIRRLWLPHWESFSAWAARTGTDFAHWIERVGDSAGISEFLTANKAFMAMIAFVLLFGTCAVMSWALARRSTGRLHLVRL